MRGKITTHNAVQLLSEVIDTIQSGECCPMASCTVTLTFYRTKDGKTLERDTYELIEKPNSRKRKA